MKRGRKSGLRLALLIGLQLVQVISMSATSARAFQFWPSKFASKSARQEQRPASASLSHIRHRPDDAVLQTKTTTTTPAPLELHFELNAEPPEAQQQQQLQADASAIEMQTPNGSLILEDLVQQFERIFNQKKRGVEPGDEAPNSVRYDAWTNASSQQQQQPNERHLAEIVVEPTTEISLELPEASSPKPTPNDSLVEPAADLEDRHIQYDMNVSAAAGNELGTIPQMSQRAGSAINETEASMRNFTLEPIRVQSERFAVVQMDGSLDFRRRVDAPEGGSEASSEGSQVVYSNNTLLVMPPGQKNQQQQRQKAHQARSMSSVPGASQRAPQHSKPPYASYNQFHSSRSELSNAARPTSLQYITTNNHNNRTSPPQAAAGTQTVNSTLQQAGHQTGQQLVPEEPDAKLEAASELVQSISRISTHLAGEATRQQDEQANGTAPTIASSTTTLRPPHGSDVIAHSYELLRERQQAQQQQELERMGAKLAPSNEPIDLSPIASSTPASSLDSSAFAAAPASSLASGQQASELSPSQFYFSQAPPFADSDESRPSDSPASLNLQQRFQNDRYAYGGAAGALADSASLFSQQLSEPANQLFVMRPDASASSSQAGSPLKQLAQARATSSTDRPARVPAADSGESAPGSHPTGPASASSLSLPLRPAQLHWKTLELVSNQIQHADQRASSSSGAGDNSLVRQHKERSPNSLGQARDGSVSGTGSSGGSYAASLINVTAPMVLPLSASEAMEASLDSDPATRHSILHQVGVGGIPMGLVAAGSGAGLHGGRQRPTLGASAYPATSSYLTAPHRGDERLREPAYSLAAGSLLSRPSSYATSGPDQAPFGAPQTSLEAAFGAAATTSPPALSVSERDRMRPGDLARTSPAGQQASGFRSPYGNHNAYSANPDGLLATSSASWFQTTSLPTPASYLSGATSGRFSAGGGTSTQAPLAQTAGNSSALADRNQSNGQTPLRNSTSSSGGRDQVGGSLATTNGFLTGAVSPNSSSSSSDSQQQTLTGSQQQVAQPAPQTSVQVGGSSGGAAQQVGAGAPSASKRVFNLTRVEHISAECSNDLIRTLIIFNGTFKGIIYSSGYVRDPSCMYVNGTGKTRYDFSIRLNQCGTLGRQELHPSSRPNELNRRDQLMWNTLSIQYNPIVEQEWDEHFRVSCEYAGDFWKTISFSPFNVETNTGSPVVFTVDPPQCQMEILKGHGTVGPRQEPVSGPVTVGDPLTLLIHMKSEKAGYDILVKNCIAHNGGQQKMQLIDNSGCVVNERFISPFRGTYNDNDLKHVTLYSYLKAFRFTGSPVLYLECEVHMCQSACPPQMCYWRTLSKRSINETGSLAAGSETQFDLSDNASELDQEADLDSVRSIRFNLTASTSSTTTTTSTTTEPSAAQRQRSQRRGRNLRQPNGEGVTKAAPQRPPPASENLSDRVSLFQALEVRQEREPESLPAEAFASEQPASGRSTAPQDQQLDATMILCYRRAGVFAFMFTVASILLAAISLTIGCCFRASSLKRQAAKSKQQQQFVSQALSLTSANLGYSPLTSYLSCSPSSTGSSSSSSNSFASNHSPTSPRSPQHQRQERRDQVYCAPEVANKQQLLAKQQQLSANSLAALIKQQQQQLKLDAARKATCQMQFGG